MTFLSNLESFPSLESICAAVLAVWPQHQSFFSLRFADPSEPTLPSAEEMAAVVVRIASNDSCRQMPAAIVGRARL